jgi:hypothetical protein
VRNDAYTKKHDCGTDELRLRRGLKAELQPPCWQPLRIGGPSTTDRSSQHEHYNLGTGTFYRRCYTLCGGLNLRGFKAQGKQAYQTPFRPFYQFVRAPVQDSEKGVRMSNGLHFHDSEPKAAGSLYLSTLLLFAFVVAAVLPWWNRYVGVTNDAWHYFYGLQILGGKVPYRDFYLFVPPLYALKNALIIALFGNHVIVPHLVAIAEILVLTFVLLIWISRVFPLLETAVGVTIAIALYIFSITAETLGGLHQEAVFFPVLAAWAVSVALTRRRIIFYALAGLLAGLAFLGKQNSGIATVTCLGVLLPALLWRLHGMRLAIIAVLSYTLGVAIPVGLTCMWLGAKGGLAAFISDVYVKGASSKGPLRDALLRPIVMIAQDVRYQVEVFLAISCLGVFFWLVHRVESAREKSEEGASFSSRLVMFFIAAFAAMAFGMTLSRFVSLSQVHTFYRNLPRNFLLFAGEIGCLVLFVQSARGFFWLAPSEHKSQFVLLCGFSSGLAYFLGLSWVDYPPIVLPSLAVLLSYVLFQLRTKRLRVARATVLAGCVLTILQYSMLRMDTPFGWGGWVEPNVRFAHQKLPEPELAGFRASAESANFVNQITQDIVANSQPGDSVLAYPDIPIFYILAHRPPATFAYVHWIDVAPDFIDQADAASILRKPPAVIIYLEQPEDKLRSGEMTFRHGRRSGVRDMIAAIDALKPQYRTLDTFKTHTGDEFVVMARRGM